MDTKTKKKINDVITDTDSNVMNTLINLSERWKDEKEFEDWKDYENVMKDLLPKDFKFIKGSKRPFGIKTKINGTEAHLFLKKKGHYYSFCCKTKTLK